MLQCKPEIIILPLVYLEQASIFCNVLIKFSQETAMIQVNLITREVAEFVFVFRIHSQKINFLKFNENLIAHQRSLLYSVINSNYSCEKIL